MVSGSRSDQIDEFGKVTNATSHDADGRRTRRPTFVGGGGGGFSSLCRGIEGIYLLYQPKAPSALTLVRLRLALIDRLMNFPTGSSS